MRGITFFTVINDVKFLGFRVTTFVDRFAILPNLCAPSLCRRKPICGTFFGGGCLPVGCCLFHATAALRAKVGYLRDDGTAPLLFRYAAYAIVSTAIHCQVFAALSFIASSSCVLFTRIDYRRSFRQIDLGIMLF